MVDAAARPDHGAIPENAVAHLRILNLAGWQEAGHCVDGCVPIVEAAATNHSSVAVINVSTSNLRSVPGLQPRWIGPFSVSSIINPVAVQMELPLVERVVDNAVRGAIFR